MRNTTLKTSWLDDRLRERFWSRVDKNGPLPDVSDPLVTAPNTPCWVWTAAKSHGYGAFTPYPSGGGRTAVAHRISYMEANGALDCNLHIDHLCRNTSCVNPDHLEAVTPKVNQHRGSGWAGRKARTTHCPAGHPYDDKHTMTSAQGRRACRECHRLRENERRKDPLIRAERARKQREYYSRKSEEKTVASC